VKRRTVWLALAAGLVFALLWLVLTQGPLAPVKVTVDRIRVSDLAPEVFGVGNIEARHTYFVAPAMGGRVSRVRVDQGDRVLAGQVVAEIDPVDLADKQDSSQHMAARAASTVKVAEAQLQEAQSRCNTTIASHARFAELHGRGFVSQEMLAAKQHEKTAALAAVEAASASLAAARREQARFRAEAAGVSKLRAQTRLTSPVSGIVAARLAEVGHVLAPGQPALQVIDPDDLWIKTRVDQRQAGWLSAGLKAVVVLRSQPQLAIAGTLVRVDLISDAVTEERIVNVAFTAPGLRASLGEFAEVTFQLPRLKQVRALPSAAVKRIGQQEAVWLLQDGRARLRTIRTGLTTLDGQTQVVEGLSEQDEVIVYSQQALYDGLKVRVVSGLTGG
jgi:HlyD family secretion protein